VKTTLQGVTIRGIAAPASIVRSTLAIAAALSPLAAGCTSTPPYETAAHAPYPQIPTGGGPTLASATVVTVSFAGDSQSAALAAFVEWISQSGWLGRVLSEYGALGVAHGADVGLTDGAPPSLTDGDVQTLLAARIADGTIPGGPASPAPGAGGAPYLYVLFVPDGTSVSNANGDACGPNPGNGYHAAMSGAAGAVPYVVLPTCDPRFSAILSPLAGMQLDTARLLVDALTDPSPNNEPAYELTDDSSPWTALGRELGDLCWGRMVEEGMGYTLQRVWSNRAAASGGDPCIPDDASTPAFGASVSPSGLPTLQVGIASTFTLTGWSRGPVADWGIQATPWIGDYAIGVSLDRATLNNGETATLRITIPYPVASGTYGAVRVQSSAGAEAPSWPVAFLVR
jgi:hypothetical protein